jgi:hypothetical protein
MDIDTTASGFGNTPTYITSIIGTGIEQMWKVTGAANCFLPTATGFRMYIAKAGEKQEDYLKDWYVNYVGVDMRFCAVSAWGNWNTKCPCTVSTRTRRTTSSGAGCRTPGLTQTKPCRCSAPKQVSDSDGTIYIGTVY